MAKITIDIPDETLVELFQTACNNTGWCTSTLAVENMPAFVTALQNDLKTLIDADFLAKGIKYDLYPQFFTVIR